MQPHLSVLLKECLEIFSESTIEVFVDGTLGAGGHSLAILEQHPEIKHMIVIDQDEVALEIAKARLNSWKEKITFIHDNYSRLQKILQALEIDQVDGIFLDLGVSSMQFDRAEKGFSFSKDGPLDMRMDQRQDLTAADIVNHYSEADLGRLFRDYGEEKNWRRAAYAIVKARASEPILRTSQLSQILQTALYNPKKKGLHPATLVFQALRIAVNRELDHLEAVLPQAIAALKPEGRMGVISFHSLEDRIVKKVFQFEASDKLSTSGIGGMFLDKQPKVEILTRKPLIPSEEEVRENPRARSAKLRGIKKV